MYKKLSIMLLMCKGISASHIRTPHEIFNELFKKQVQAYQANQSDDNRTTLLTTYARLKDEPKWGDNARRFASMAGLDIKALSQQPALSLKTVAPSAPSAPAAPVAPSAPALGEYTPPMGGGVAIPAHVSARKQAYNAINAEWQALAPGAAPSTDLLDRMKALLSQFNHDDARYQALDKIIEEGMLAQATHTTLQAAHAPLPVASAEDEAFLLGEPPVSMPAPSAAPKKLSEDREFVRRTFKTIQFYMDKANQTEQADAKAKTLEHARKSLLDLQKWMQANPQSQFYTDHLNELDYQISSASEQGSGVPKTAQSDAMLDRLIAMVKDDSRSLKDREASMKEAQERYDNAAASFVEKTRDRYFNALADLQQMLNKEKYPITTSMTPPPSPVAVPTAPGLVDQAKVKVLEDALAEGSRIIDTSRLFGFTQKAAVGNAQNQYAIAQQALADLSYLPQADKDRFSKALQELKAKISAKRASASAPDDSTKKAILARRVAIEDEGNEQMSPLGSPIATTKKPDHTKALKDLDGDIESLDKYFNNKDDAPGFSGLKTFWLDAQKIFSTIQDDLAPEVKQKYQNNLSRLQKKLIDDKAIKEQPVNISALPQVPTTGQEIIKGKVEQHQAAQAHENESWETL